jgi:hypothetical protein
MPPLTYENLRADVGSDLTYDWQWDGQDDESAPVGLDLSAWAGTLLAGTAGAALTASTANGMLVLGADGSIALTVPAASLPAPGWYPYTLRLWTTDAPGDVTEFTRGRLDVTDPLR